MLQKIGTLIYLKTAESALKHRLMSKTLPAFIAQNNPENSFAEIYNTRIKCYENINAIMIDTKNLSHKAIIEKIINELRR
jgi:shikimate kinase